MTKAIVSRVVGYYWVKWDLPSMGWSVAYWDSEYWYVINCEDSFTDSTFEIISTIPITEPNI